MQNSHLLTAQQRLGTRCIDTSPFNTRSDRHQPEDTRTTSNAFYYLQMGCTALGHTPPLEHTPHSTFTTHTKTKFSLTTDKNVSMLSAKLVEQSYSSPTKTREANSITCSHPISLTPSKAHVFAANIPSRSRVEATNVPILIQPEKKQSSCTCRRC